VAWTKTGQARILAAVGILAACGCAASAFAAPRRAFAVPAEATTQALLDLAVQADVSIAIGDAGRCAKTSRPVHGQLTLAEALDRLLAGSGCTWQMVDAGAVRIVRAPPPRAPEPRTRAKTAPLVHGTPSPGATVVPEVLVTTTRRRALPARLPDAITVIGQARLALDRDDSVTDLTGQVAGLMVTNLGPGSDKLIMRGLSDGSLTGHAQSTVGVYLDDTRLTYNAPDPDLRLVDIAQVEALQGPQGALYGAGSIGGVVHIVTRQPDLDQFGGMVLAQAAGSIDGGPSGVVEGVLNLPIVRDRAGLRVAAYSEHDGGYVDDIRLGRDNTNTTNRSGGRLAVQVNLTPDWSLDVGAVGQDLDSADSQYASARLGDYRRAVLLMEPHGNSFEEVHVTLDGAMSPGRFRNTLSLLRHDTDTRYDASGVLPLLADTAPAPTAYDERDRIDTLLDEATLSSVGASPLQWLVGAFVSLGRQGLDSQIAEVASAAPTPAVYAEHRTDSIQEIAAYGEASYDLSPRLTASAGARLGVIEVATRSLVSNPSTGATAPFSGHISDLEVEPKVSLSYRVNPDLLAYFLVSEGERGGGFNTGGPVGTVFSARVGEREPLRRFQGDELWNVEAGVKARALSDQLDLRAFAFYAAWSNIQSDQLLPSGIVYTANIGDGRNVGVEAEATYGLGDFDFHVASLLDEPELTNRSGPFPALLYSGLPGVPRVTVSGSLHYQRRSGDIRPFFDTEVAYVGPSRMDFAPTLSRRMGDYTMTRLTGGADLTAWRLSLFVDNPLGVRGDTFSFGNPFTIRRARQVTPLPPTTGGLQVVRNF
jgi:outer membrane receptor protein involved in Fe transport